MKISQSLLRDFQDYLKEKSCGLQFVSKYIDHTYPDMHTEAQAAGQWFEYVCTGSTPRNSGIAPEPVMLKSKPTEFSALYRQLNAHIDNWKLIAQPTEQQYGVVIEAEFDGIQLIGITDIINDTYTGDIKTTGHIHNKWEEYGWGGEIEGKPAMVQAKFYTLIRYIQTGKIYPFYFYIFSSGSEDWMIVKVQLSETALDLFKDEVKWLADQLEYHLSIGFEAYPDYKRCAGCGLKDTCKSFTNIPKIKEIYF